MTLADILETAMILSFGISWPLSLLRSWRSRTAKGKSLFFEVFILLGYAFGIVRKIIQTMQPGGHDFIFYLGFFFYIFNFVAISIDIALYFRNRRLDQEREAKDA